MILKAKQYSLGLQNREINVYTFRKIIIVSFGRKNRKDSLLKGVDEKDKNFKYGKNKINENNLKRRICYRFPKHEPVDHLEDVLVFDLETQNDQEFAETYAAGLYDVNRLRDKRSRDLTSDELVIERENVTVFDASNGNFVVDMLKYISAKLRSC